MYGENQYLVENEMGTYGVGNGRNMAYPDGMGLGVKSGRDVSSAGAAAG